jgi:tryptophan synthase alpha chain
MPANRLDTTFAAARAAGKKLLCPFLTAGYPSQEATPELLLAVQDALGEAGIIELGIPFSDPVADGPVIQASFTEALLRGATVANSLASVKAAREKGLALPVVAMVSFTIIFKKGTRQFGELCKAHGLDGVILPDIPVEEAPAVVEVFRGLGLRSTLLVAPTTPPARREAIARLCDGFVYYLSVSGITGERKALPADIAPNVQALRAATANGLPICVGFGISTPEQVREVTRVADGAIVGSAVIRKIGESANLPVAEQRRALAAYLRQLADGLT